MVSDRDEGLKPSCAGAQGPLSPGTSDPTREAGQEDRVAFPAQVRAC